MNTIIIYVIVFFASLLMTYGLWRFPLRYLLDNAVDRSLHTGIVPRSGGIAILVSFLIAYAMAGISFFEPVLLAALLLLCVVSLWDDVTSLPQGWRLLIQVFACAIMVFVGQLYIVVWEGFPILVSQMITLFGLVWMINLYNFMDGMDGFASGMGMMGFGTLSVLGYLKGDLDYLVMNGCWVAAIAGFWFWNFPPARIFMGDTGAILLGAMAGIMALLGVQKELFPLWVPVIIFSPFWVDATYTLFRRMAGREKYWQAHRSHLYQRLVSSGLGHRVVVLWQYLLMAACALTVFLPPLFGLEYNSFPPMVWGVLYPVLILLVELRLKK